MALTLNEKFLAGFVGEGEIASLAAQTRTAHETVRNASGAGSDFLGSDHVDVRSFDHCVSSFDGGHQTSGFDHAQCFQCHTLYLLYRFCFGRLLRHLGGDLFFLSCHF